MSKRLFVGLFALASVAEGWPAMPSRRCLFLLVLILAPTMASAQDSHWGVAASMTPKWKTVSKLDEVLFDAESVDLEGSAFTIGIARGRSLSGDWGVSYVRRPVKDGSHVRLTADLEQPNCEIFVNGCITFGDYRTTRDVVLNGVQVHKYIPFGTIKRRVQIGLNIAGGVGSFSGELEEHKFNVEEVSSNPLRVRQVERVTTEPARDLLSFSPVPIGAIQAAVAVIMAPGLKIRAAGGVGLPGNDRFTVTGVYLFGAR
jgi:hypothetical protein